MPCFLDAEGVATLLLPWTNAEPVCWLWGPRQLQPVGASTLLRLFRLGSWVSRLEPGPLQGTFPLGVTGMQCMRGFWEICCFVSLGHLWVLPSTPGRVQHHPSKQARASDSHRSQPLDRGPLTPWRREAALCTLGRGRG